MGSLSYRPFLGWLVQVRSFLNGGGCLLLYAHYLHMELTTILNRCHRFRGFVIVANMNKALDRVRAEESSRMKREGRDPVLKKSRWLLLKRSENLGDEQHFRLRGRKS
jgi:transposase